MVLLEKHWKTKHREVGRGPMIWALGLHVVALGSYPINVLTSGLDLFLFVPYSTVLFFFFFFLIVLHTTTYDTCYMIYTCTYFLHHTCTTLTCTTYDTCYNTITLVKWNYS